MNTKICLSISAHHPEHWQPSWSLRTALVALVAFFPAPADGAIGAINYSPEERRALARASRTASPGGTGASEPRAALCRELHQRLASLTPPPPEPEEVQAAHEGEAGGGEAGEGEAGEVGARDAPVPAAEPLPPPRMLPPVAVAPRARVTAPAVRAEGETPLLVLAGVLMAAILALVLRRLFPTD